MKSMTGYGAAQISADGYNYECSLKSVNGRFLEVKFHGPREIQSLEGELRSRLSQQFTRGTVDIYFSRQLVDSAKKAALVQIDENLISHYFKAYEQIAKNLKLKEKPSVASLLRLPEVIKVPDKNSFEGADKSNFLQAFQRALVSWTEEKSREGKALEVEIGKQLRLLREQLSEITKSKNEVQELMSTRLREKITSRLGSYELDPQRLAQELAILAEKADIDEETVRLAEHLQHFEESLCLPQGIGKKLDFYTQELLREVNTIGSKSQVLAVTKRVVECKVIIERIREQVQNIE